jgi:copper chaperone NosL
MVKLAMTRFSQVLLLISSFLLLLVYFFPLWSIHLQAPQYPEGMGLKIGISSIFGMKQYDLQNINRLNHYIGMKEIQPESIPELQFMPWLIAFLIVSGLAITALNKSSLLLIWLLLFGLLAVAGLIDFYNWMYDYGHNLNPEAPIKIPGMSYQPPLIGHKQLLNIHATSFPSTGGWAVFIALVLGVFAYISDYQARKKLKLHSQRNSSFTRLTILPLFMFFLGLLSCSRQPVPIRFGLDECEYCRMLISEPRFASELITDKGKVFTFDSIECLAAFSLQLQGMHAKQNSYWVSDYSVPERFLSAESSIFIESAKIKSPMGLNLLAVSGEEKLPPLLADTGGRMLTWVEVLELVKESWLE